jgi:uncharacterized protein (TIGR01777 family)
LRVFLTGASGLIGSRLARDLVRDGHGVRAVSRLERSARVDSTSGGIEWIVGDIGEEGQWCDALDGCDAVVHLAGEPVAAGRWTAARKQRLVSSRVESTRLMVAAMQRASVSPRTLVCASASGFYGARGDEELSEASAPGDDFLARLCVDWEAAANKAVAQQVRVVSLRFGVVLSQSGGALARMRVPFKLGLGGPLGPPESWFPWVHEDDAVGLARFALEQRVAGPVNVVAPGCVTMGEFAKTLGRVLGRPALLPVPKWLLDLALGEMAAGLTPGQKIAPQAALAAGYAFRHPAVASALAASL